MFQNFFLSVQLQSLTGNSTPNRIQASERLVYASPKDLPDTPRQYGTEGFIERLSMEPRIMPRGVSFSDS